MPIQAKPEAQERKRVYETLLHTLAGAFAVALSGGEEDYQMVFAEYKHCSIFAHPFGKWVPPILESVRRSRQKPRFAASCAFGTQI